MHILEYSTFCDFVYLPRFTSSANINDWIGKLTFLTFFVSSLNLLLIDTGICVYIVTHSLNIMTSFHCHICLCVCCFFRGVGRRRRGGIWIKFPMWQFSFQLKCKNIRFKTITQTHSTTESTHRQSYMYTQTNKQTHTHIYPRPSQLYEYQA